MITIRLCCGLVWGKCWVIVDEFGKQASGFELIEARIVR